MRLAITILCGAGFYVSLFMLRKTRLAERGAVNGPSVVTEPHARLFLGAPNALFGTCYFPLLALSVWLSPLLVTLGGSGSAALLRWLAVLGVVVAGATSFFLAYSLLFVTKRECAYCWSSHVINWLLLFMVPVDLFR